MNKTDEIRCLREENQSLRNYISQLHAADATTSPLGTVLRVAQVGMWNYDLQTRTLLLNSECAALLGFLPVAMTLSAEEWLEMIHPDDLPNALFTWQEFTAGIVGLYIGEFRVKSSSGAYKWMLSFGLIAERSSEGLPLRAAGIHLDSSAIRALQDALRCSQPALQQSENRWQFALEGSGDGVWDWSLENNTTFFSRRWKEMLGYAEDEIPHQCEEWASRVHPDDSERVMETQMRHVRGETPDYATEYRMRCKDGTYKWILARGKVIALTSEGKPSRMVGTHTDISERRANEAERLRLTAGLEERTHHLEAVNSELEAFAYAAAHDLRAPLRSMEGFSQALLEDYADVLDARASDYLGRIHAAAQRMRQLIESLQKLSQITQEGLNREQLDLTQLAESVVQDIKEPFVGRDIAVAIQPEMTAFADPTLLRVVLTNLLSNAYKFTGKKTKAAIEIGTAYRENQTVYFVRDNGAGFEQEYAFKLFRPFQRLHSSAEFEGTGIGLATVKRIIHRHGGRVWAEGIPEQGATFYFTL